ncbi:MAG TPA: polysaccharide deacetylase family protein [Kofleriaceae bacterium]
MNWDQLDKELDRAAARAEVVTFHSHVPGMTVSVDTIQRVLAEAQARDLDFVTYAQLDDDLDHGALAYAFDDDAVGAWLTTQDLLAQYGAKVTYFVTRWQNMDDTARAGVHQLWDSGHDVEAHTVNHLHAVDYVAANGLPAYLADEVEPSLAIMTQEGFSTGAFAFPFGETDPDITRAVLEHVHRVRIGPGDCPTDKATFGDADESD